MEQNVSLEDIGDILILRSRLDLTVEMLESVWQLNAAPEEEGGRT